MRGMNKALDMTESKRIWKKLQTQKDNRASLNPVTKEREELNSAN